MRGLVVYYSLEGNTEFIAKEIAAELGSDLLKIRTAEGFDHSDPGR